MSTFASIHVHSLLDSIQHGRKRATPSASTSEVDVTTKDTTEDGPDDGNGEARKLQELLLLLKSPLDAPAVRRTLAALTEHEHSRTRARDKAVASEQPPRAAPPAPAEDVLRAALLGTLLAGLYAQALDGTLRDACACDAEAEWWADVERETRGVAWYLLVTLPERLHRGLTTILTTLRARGEPVRLNTFTPSSLRALFPRRSSLHPSALLQALFPHLEHLGSRSGLALLSARASPLALAREECARRREALTALRDSQARRLGTLVALRPRLGALVEEGRVDEAVGSFVEAFSEQDGQLETDLATTPGSALALLNTHVSTQLPFLTASYAARFGTLRRPSRLAQAWPRIALLPPLALIAFRYLYGARESIAESALRGAETVRGFWVGYVVEPVKSILDTVRSGGEGEGAVRIVSKEGVEADRKSLERMVLQLSRDRLAYDAEQLEALAERVRQGDFTPALEVYEADIRTPIRSALAGTLIRSLLIQIQKAKVDLDQTLTGIDRLLKSQELTFAFVGVAPALAIVYVAFGYVRGLWQGGRGNKRFGGRRKRESTLLAIRRVERILTSHPDSKSEANTAAPSTVSTVAPSPASDAPLAPLPAGLLLISSARLRAFAEAHLPPRSRLREGVLEDVADLENPALGRRGKLRVVDRMWRAWGSVLGWGSLGVAR